jgi:signal transduction histidine kinase/ligand-binding sensor domain-containing protein
MRVGIHEVRDKIILSWLASCVFLFPSRAHPLSPDVTLAQLGHSAWRLQDGALPGVPNVLAQTADGYIWIGTQSGLIRFDGAEFVAFVPPNGQGLRSPTVTALYGAADGSLWIGTTLDLERWKDGQLRQYAEPSGLFAAVREAPDGSIWASRYHTGDDAGPLCRALEKTLRCYGPQQGLPFSDAGPLAIERTGAIWIATANKLARWERGRSQVFAPAGLAASGSLEGFKSVVIAPDGSIWSGVLHGGPGLGLQHFADHKWQPLVTAHEDTSTWEVTALLFDHDHTLWVGTLSRGICRIAGARIDHFGLSDGLTADSISGIFEDREGNVWVATAKGIDKFRQTRVVTFSSRQGLSADNAQAVLASRTGAIWVSNGALDRISDGTVTTYRERDGLPGKTVTALFEDHRGVLWIGVDDGVSTFDRGHFTKMDSVEGPIGPVLQFAETPDGTVWGASVLPPYRLVRMNGSRVLDSIAAPPGKRITGVVSGPDGTVWVALYSDLARFRGGRWDIIPLHRPPRTGLISEIVVPDAHTVLAATNTDILEWRDGTVRSLTTQNGLPCKRADSLAFDQRGDLWIYLSCGLAVIEPAQLENWWREPATKLRLRLLDTYDGVQAAHPDFHPTAAVAPDGKLWFANSTDVQMVDANHLLRNPLIPNVVIQGLSGDGRFYDPRLAVELPPLTRSVRIDFTALSFVVPQRVRFRYRLDGWDTEWQDPGARRQSFYTNLAPGAYRFSVIASNDDGVWNTRGDSLTFRIAPAYYQTWWFKLLCAAAGLLLLQSAYIYRLRRAKVSIQQRLSARLGERERIARELHDTLLQGIQGLLLKFHALANSLPSESTARRTLDQLLAQTRGVIEEARARVRDLRGVHSPSIDLADLLRSYSENCSQASSSELTVSVIGRASTLNPIACEEALSIAREAIANAFTHADAKHIEIEITYGPRALALRVRDDGKGMDQATVDSGRVGHWGIVGMRERARSFGAELKIWSRSGVGTEIELNIPAALAYPQSAEGPRRQWIEVLRSRLWSRRTRRSALARGDSDPATPK